MGRFSVCSVVVPEATLELVQAMNLCLCYILPFRYGANCHCLFCIQMYPLMPHVNLHEMPPLDDFRTLQCFSHASAQCCAFRRLRRCELYTEPCWQGCQLPRQRTLPFCKNMQSMQTQTKAHEPMSRIKQGPRRKYLL